MRYPHRARVIVLAHLWDIDRLLPLISCSPSSVCSPMLLRALQLPVRSPACLMLDVVPTPHHVLPPVPQVYRDGWQPEAAYKDSFPVAENRVRGCDHWGVCDV